jgi:hypothetical protein
MWFLSSLLSLPIMWLDFFLLGRQIQNENHTLKNISLGCKHQLQPFGPFRQISDNNDKSIKSNIIICVKLFCYYKRFMYKYLKYLYNKYFTSILKL